MEICFFFLFWSLKISFVSSHHAYPIDFRALNAWGQLIQGQLESRQHTCITKVNNSTRKIYIAPWDDEHVRSFLQGDNRSPSLHGTSDVPYNDKLGFRETNYCSVIRWFQLINGRLGSPFWEVSFRRQGIVFGTFRWKYNKLSHCQGIISSKKLNL